MRELSLKNSKRKSEAVFKTPEGYFQVVWTEKFKSTLKRRDQRQIDIAHLRGVLSPEMHEVACLWWGLAYTAQVNGDVSSQLGRLNRTGGSGAGRTYSNKQVEARKALSKVRQFVLERFGSTVFNLLQGFIIYDCSIREFSEISGHKDRKGLSQQMKDCLHTLYDHQYLFSR